MNVRTFPVENNGYDSKVLSSQHADDWEEINKVYTSQRYLWRHKGWGADLICCARNSA